MTRAKTLIIAAIAFQSERTGIENKWSALTGRVVALKVETRQATSRGSWLLKYRKGEMV